MEVLIIKKISKFSILMGVIAALAAVTAAGVALMVFFDRKRKDEEELDDYLNCAIQ